MACVLEHSGIGPALRQAGIDLGPACVPPHDLPQLALSGVGPAVAITWSARSSLLLDPAWAFLSEPSVLHVRLPDLPSDPESLRCPGGPVAPTLCVPLGQFQWALSELLGALSASEGPSVVRLRLDKLDGFCRRHWTRWYSALWTSLADAVHLGEERRARAVLRRVLERAPEVAVLDALSPAAIELCDTDKAPGVTQAALAYAADSAAMHGHLLDNLTCDAWWKRCAARLAEAQAHLAQVRLTGADPDTLLDGAAPRLAGEMAACARALERLLAGPADLPSESVRAAYEAVVRVRETAGRIAANVQSLRHTLTGPEARATN